MMNIRHPFRALWPVAVIALHLCNLSSATAQDPLRIWVDTTGRFSIEAALVELRDGQVILLRQDGGKSVMPISQLSEQDKKFIDKHREKLENDTSMRLAPPTAPNSQPLARLDLPAARKTAENGSELALGGPFRSIAVTQPPAALAPDPAPDSIDIDESQYKISKIDSYDICSPTMFVGSQADPAMGMSISPGLNMPGNDGDHRLIKFLANGRVQEVYSGSHAVTLLDHHVDSGRSLVLAGHNPLGHGGSLAIATGWDVDHLTIQHDHPLPEQSAIGQFPHVRWAKLVDEEHAVALVDQSLICWNLVSGKMKYRVNEVNEKTQPAISGGRRYIAVPQEGFVDLIGSTDGRSLGRIQTDANAVANVSFSRQGHLLAIATTRRIRTWDLARSMISNSIVSRRSLGQGAPIWIDADLLIAGSGVMISLYRQVAVWRYEISGSNIVPMGQRVAIFRKHPETVVSVTTLPHRGASRAMRWIDQSPRITNPEKWNLPGRSIWTENQWSDRDVRVSQTPAVFR